MNVNFELYKVKREIETHGKTYTFLRHKTDEYNQTVEETEIVAENVNGLFHTAKGYITKSVSDASLVHSKGMPQILAATEDVGNINAGDFVVLSNGTYKVIEKNDILLLGIVTDLSMELVLDGRN